MRNSSVIKNSILFNIKKIIILVLAVALSTAILSGALFLGDSVKFTILTLGTEKLGDSRYVINSGDINNMLPRLNEAENDSGIVVVPILKLPGTSLINNSGLSLEHFNAYAVDSRFFGNYRENYALSGIKRGTAVINEYLAQQLDLRPGDSIQFRCGYFSRLSPSFSFFRNEQEFLIKEVEISEVLPDRGPGRFSTSVNQGIEPLILFNLDEYQDRFSLGKSVNLYLTSGEKDISAVSEMSGSAWNIYDSGYRLKELPDEWNLLESDQLFIKPEILTALKKEFPGVSPVFSYFVNSAESTGNKSPFHFITALDKDFIEEQFGLVMGDNQAVISNWLADDLNIRRGNDMTLEFYITGTNQQLEKSSAEFSVSEVTSQELFSSLTGMVPDFPGLSGMKSCSDWEPGIPVDLNLVREKDEAYWDDWGTTPKILITYDKAEEVWANDSAVATGVLIPSSIEPESINKALSAELTPAQKGYYIEDYIERVSTSGGNSINFSELFLGLSFLLIAAAILLLFFIIRIFYEARTDEIFTLKASGFSGKSISRLYLCEVLIFTVPGVVTGAALGLVYNRLLMEGLRTIWNDAARLDIVLMNFTLRSLLVAAISALVINLAASYTVISGIIKKVVIPKKPARKFSEKDHTKIIAVCTLLIIILLVSLTVLYHLEILNSTVIFFFAAGGLLLVLFPLLAVLIIKSLSGRRSGTFSAFRLSLSNLNYNLPRAISIILITSLSVFMIISIGANKLNSDFSNSEKGTGRYEISVGTAQPLSPQTDDFAEFLKIPAADILPLRIREGDEASCLNLNRITVPRITGINPEIPDIENRFDIVEETVDGAGWQVLNEKYENNIIPAAADKGVLTWSLGLKTGDSLDIKAEDGEVYTLVFKSALSNSVFQGSVLISESNFLKLFPSSKGYNRFLIDLPGAAAGREQTETIERLNRLLRPSGPVTRSSMEILNDYYSVQNTYISIFFQLGLAAVVFAAAGISILLFRKIQEERKELSIQIVMGFRKKRIFTGLFAENFITVVYGISAGAVSSIIALLPIFSNDKILLLRYPLSAFLVISVCSAVFLTVFICAGLKSFRRFLPEYM